MFQFSTAHWCERRIGAASGQAGPEVWPSRTHVQNGKRLAAYGDCARFEIGVLAGRRALRSHPCRDKTEQELNTPMWVAGDRRASITAKTLSIPYFSCSGGCPGIGHKQCAGGHRLACDEL